MTKRIAIIATLLWAIDLNAQISVDSLLSITNTSFSKTGTREYLSETFTIFKSENKKERYDIFLDSTNQLSEYIGLSIVHYSFDELNRIILIEGFSSKGVRSYWDFPVIQIFRYVSDTVVVQMNNIKNEICKCQSLDTLSDVVITKEKTIERIYDKVRISVSSKDSMMKLAYAICSNGKVCQRGENAYYVYHEFGGKRKKKITQERYYDNELRLVNGKHDVHTTENSAYSVSTIPYAYSIRELEEGEIETINFYNKKGKLVGKRENLPWRGPINAPSPNVH